MILAMVGTQKLPFTRLLREIDELIIHADISDEVIVQTGSTKYEQKKFISYNYIDEQSLLEYINKAEVIITHGGCGSIFNAILAGKKIIAVARLSKYGEMVDDHQLELITKLSKDGYILNGSDSLIDTWNLVHSFNPRKYDFAHNIVPNLKKYLDTFYIAPSIL